MPRKFDFVSPGISIEEIDESIIESPPQDDGLLIIGRSVAGPTMRPTKVKNLADFVTVFGKPVSGKGSADDVWRNGNNQSPTYAAYAAQAWLASETSPVTFIRLAGNDSPDQATGYVKAGWNLGGASLGNATADHSTNVTAYGLFVIPSSSNADINSVPSGSLAAVFYTTGSTICLSGTIASTTNATATTSSVCTLIESVETGGTPSTFVIEVRDNHTSVDGSEKISFHFDPDKKDNYLRNVLNTNPLKALSTNYGSSNTKKYFLGESYEEAVQSLNSGSTAGKQYGIILPLVSGSNNLVDHLAEARPARTGWIINRDPSPQNNASSFAADQMKKLFRLVSLHDGEWFQNNYYVTFEDLRIGTVANPNSTFTVAIRKLGSGNLIEMFSNCNLDESSEKFVGKLIGDMSHTWNTTNEVFDISGNYPNRSDYVRVEMADDWKSGISDSYMLPWGFFGPVRPKGFSLTYGSKGAQNLNDFDQTGATTKSTRTITYSDGMATGDDLIFTHPDLGAFTINFVASTGAADTVFNTNQVAEIHPATTNTNTATATAVAALLNTIPNYTATAASNVVTVTAGTAGPHLNVVITENTDTHSRQTISSMTPGTDTDDNTNVYVKGNAIINSSADADLFAKLPASYSASVSFPRLKLTEQATNKAGINYRNTDVFGLRHKFASKNEEGVAPKKDYLDIIRYQGGAIDMDATAPATEYSFVFSMDEIVSDGNGRYYWASGSHTVAQYEITRALTAASGSNHLIDNKIKQFAVNFHGGFDGIDIRHADPFSHRVALDGKAENTSYAYYSISKAIDICRSAESVKFDVISMPGMINSALNKELVTAIENRADALALIDIDDGFSESYENNGTQADGSLSSFLTNVDTENFNSSYAASYHPRVRMRDTMGGNGDIIITPPTVAACGAIAFSDGETGAPWFAPAGFNRGGLGTLGGSQGPQVIGAQRQLSKLNRDDLYARNINPVARFPAIGETVIFGQKTLQQTKSALDRINVRRLMIFLKKRVGRVAETILFDQNVQSTWDRFTAGASLILNDAQSRLGIVEYKLVLDETTTTADLIDQNILYAKIFIKPARAIEFIAIDFIITKTGIEF